MYGVNEVNPITDAQKARMSQIKRKVCWTTKGLEITRLRLLSDQGFPFWDVSYCVGSIGDEMVDVALPFSQLPKKNMKKALFDEAKATGTFINGLFSSISSLV